MLTNPRGSVSEYDVTTSDIRQAIKAIEMTFAGRVNVTIQADKTCIPGADLWMRVAFFAGVEYPDEEPFDEVIWVLPNERTKTVNGSMLWFLCELYDKLEARTRGTTVTHAKALPRFLAAHWGRGAK